MSKSYDIVIVGSGIAGLSTLLYLSETDVFKQDKLSICLIVKGSFNETNTHWAQGGIAAVNSIGDNFDKHIQDTLNAGAYINNNVIVEKVVKNAPGLLNDLIHWGTHFDKNNKGEYDLAKEGGHSDARIWHKEDQTGKEIQEALSKKIFLHKHVHIHEHACVMNVNQLPNHIFGIQVFEKHTQTISTIISKKLVLATGGVGMLYDKTTNQRIATGDGVYLAHQLGAAIENLSFIQFHPTGLYENGQNSFLISEALRGAGAVLRNEHGVAFMIKYDERKELAPRDIVSRAIITEIELQSKPYVYLDATQIEKHILDSHFPSIKKECMDRMGLDIGKDLIPVLPVQHYSCGGVKVNEFGETSIAGLFAIGEIASTGLHGANRLASNSLLEAIAFAKFSIPKLIDKLDQHQVLTTNIEIPQFKMVDRIQIQYLMQKFAGIVKSNKGLEEALKQLNEIKLNAEINQDFNFIDFENTCLLEVSILLIKDALSQTTNKGVFYNIDLV